MNQQPAGTLPIPTEPVWPLPRRRHGLSEAEIRVAFRRHRFRHYAWEFEGGLSFPARHHKPDPDADAKERPLKRFRHMMPWLLGAVGGGLSGKRVLDIACNSGFWSFQCALLGAREVVGFDARAALVEQAFLVQEITGLSNVRFQVLDFREMAPAALGGTFDVVLNLGILYHLPDPLRALELTRAMARERSHILLDTACIPSTRPILRLQWEEPFDIHMAAAEGISAKPSESALEMMFRHLRFRGWMKIPVTSSCRWHLSVYLTGHRGAWLLTV